MTAASSVIDATTSEERKRPQLVFLDSASSGDSARAVIEPTPPRPDPQPEPPPEPVPDPLPEPPKPQPEPEPPSAMGPPVRIEAPDPASAALLMQQAVGSFHAELVDEERCWVVLIHPDRPREQLVHDTIELTQRWLASAHLPAATVTFDGRHHRIQQ